MCARLLNVEAIDYWFINLNTQQEIKWTKHTIGRGEKTGALVCHA